METAAYLPVADTDVYVVRHEPEGEPRAAVLMAGPFGLERTHAYSVWVRVARALAREGFDVLRFDYRGNGESGGDFERATFDAWVEDAERCIDQIGASKIGLFGLRAGALVLSRAFERRGDALLLWEPPRSGRAHLLEILRHKLASDYAEGEERRSRDEYVRELESGRVVEVEGYPWTRAFWESAARFEISAPADRPRCAIYAEGSGEGLRVALQRPLFWRGSTSLAPDISALLEPSVRFLRDALA